MKINTEPEGMIRERNSKKKILYENSLEPRDIAFQIKREYCIYSMLN